MPLPFEELDVQSTPLGELVLRRRRVASLDGAEVVEVKLAGALLMSSMVNETEIALAQRTLGELGGRDIDVLVGGLGLGYTARAALAFENVRRLTVIDTLEPVIGWHRAGLLPLGRQLCDDARCRLVHDDFFRVVAAEPTDERYDAILLDIDHSPGSLLDERHAAFYQPAGLRQMARHLKPDGLFALWAAGRPDEEFITRLGGVLRGVQTHEITFFNPLVHEEEVNTIYVGRAPHS